MKKPPKLGWLLLCNFVCNIFLKNQNSLLWTSCSLTCILFKEVGSVHRHLDKIVISGLLNSLHKKGQNLNESSATVKSGFLKCLFHFHFHFHFNLLLLKHQFLSFIYDFCIYPKVMLSLRCYTFPEEQGETLSLLFKLHEGCLIVH